MGRVTSRKILILFLVLLVLPGSAGADEAGIGATLTYLGNEGFLIEGDDRSVLVDALVSPWMPRYAMQSPELRNQLVNAQPPFDQVSLVLTSHVHGDHFGADAVAQHLLANPEAMLFSTGEVAAELSRHPDFDAIRSRVQAVPEESEFPGWNLRAIPMHHGTGRNRPDNLGFVFSVGGVRFLHMGDTEVTAEELEAMDLPPIDVALVPSWYLDARPWKGAVETTVRAKQMVVMHLAPDWETKSDTPNQRESRDRVPRIRSAYPEAVIFSRALESRHFPGTAEDR